MKTACEEAAEWLKQLYPQTSIEEIAERRADMDKRLRAEGRELKRYRRLALAADGTPAYLVIRSLMREAARIQKARKK